MSRLLTLLSLVLILAACDSSDELATAEVSIGDTYSASTFRVTNGAGTTFDLLDAGARLDLTFWRGDRFDARLFIPRSAILATGDTQDLDDFEGDFDVAFEGTYAQLDGALTFTESEFTDTFLRDEGWTIDPNGRAIRYDDSGRGQERTEVVLKRR